MTVTTIYGIANCDSVKKARKWLFSHNISYVFHDYRKDGLDKAMLDSFLEKTTWIELLNKRSSSYRQLSDLQKSSLNSENVVDLFIELPTLIKRPLLIHDASLQLGFKTETYQTLFSL